MKAADIKPCPFCGSSNIEVKQTNPQAIWFGCEDCGAETSSEDHIDRALELWNQRAEPANVS